MSITFPDESQPPEYPETLGAIQTVQADYPEGFEGLLKNAGVIPGGPVPNPTEDESGEATDYNFLARNLVAIAEDLRDFIKKFGLDPDDPDFKDMEDAAQDILNRIAAGGGGGGGLTTEAIGTTKSIVVPRVGASGTTIILKGFNGRFKNSGGDKSIIRIDTEDVIFPSADISSETGPVIDSDPDSILSSLSFVDDSSGTFFGFPSITTRALELILTGNTGTADFSWTWNGTACKGSFSVSNN